MLSICRSLDDQTFYRCSLRSRRQISSNDLHEDFCDDEDANFWNDGDVELGSGGGGGGGEDPMSFPQIESIDVYKIVRSFDREHDKCDFVF